MLSGIGKTAAPIIRTAATQQAKQAAASASFHTPTPNPLLKGLQGREISTVSKGTVMDENGNVKDAGHIQMQTSEGERRRQPGLPPAIGHSPQFGRGIERESFPVSSTLPNGQPFNVVGTRAPAKKAGDDKVIKNPDKTIDHGEMSDEQIRTIMTQKDKPIFERYETSGHDEANCVHGHAKVAESLGLNVGTVAKHARPQDLAEKMDGMKLDD